MFTKNIKGGYLWDVGLQRFCFLFCILYIVWILFFFNKSTQNLKQRYLQKMKQAKDY